MVGGHDPTLVMLLREDVGDRDMERSALPHVTECLAEKDVL